MPQFSSHRQPRRSGPRQHLSRPVKLYDPLSERYFSGHLLDESDQGGRLRLEGHCPLQPGAQVRLYVAPVGQSAGLVSLQSMQTAQVAWMRRDGQGCLQAGVRLLAASNRVAQAA